MGKGSGDRPDLHIDLLNDSTRPPQFREYAPIFRRGRAAVWADDQPGQGVPQSLLSGLTRELAVNE